MPAPGRNLLRYHGTLAPNARWRWWIVPTAGVAEEEDAEGGATCEVHHGRARAGGEDAVAASRRSDWIPWAELLRRVFAEDVLKCPRCGGRMRIVAAVTSPTGIRKILEHLGLPARAPPLARARLAEDERDD